MANAKAVPSLRHHKGRELGYVRVKRTDTYFSGKWPRSRKTPPTEIAAQYQDWLNRWYMVGRSAEKVETSSDPTIAEIWLGYLTHCESWYIKDGKHTSEVQCIRDACSIVAKLFGDTPARLFSPKKLKEVREAFLASGWARQHVNKQVSRVRRMFRWAVSEELVPVAVLTAIETIEDIPKGRIRGLREQRKVTEIPWEVVELTFPALPQTLQELIRFHWLVGCRAGEACVLHVDDIDRETNPELWCWSPRRYKTEHLDDDEPFTYWLGPKAQTMLRPILERAEKPRFRKAGRRTIEIPPIGYCFDSGRTRGEGHWTTASYRRAVKRAIDQLNSRENPPTIIPHWYPLQIRHSKAEIVRRSHPKGIEAVQAALGHKEVTTSQIYARRTTELAQEIAKQLG